MLLRFGCGRNSGDLDTEDAVDGDYESMKDNVILLHKSISLRIPLTY